MNNPLQEKDDQWRNRRANGATPVFDPGMAPLGSDDEAGGGSIARHGDPSASEPRRPMPTSPDAGGHGLKLTPRFWYGALAVVVAIFAVVAALSLIE